MCSMRGMPILLLTTTGRKTGKRRTTPLMYLMDGGRYVVTASNNGRENYPGWYYNLQADPNVQIELPGARLEACASLTPVGDRERLWKQLVTRAPFFDNYLRATNRRIPMITLDPASQV